MNKTKLALSLVIALAVAPAVQASPVELVSNGGFETGNFTSWTRSGNLGFTGVNNQAHTGSFAAIMGPIGSDGFLTQTLSTVIGKLYNITFWLAHDGGTPNDFGVTFGGNTVFSQFNAGGSGYTMITLANVAASSVNDALVFNFRQDPAYYHLDDVSVTAAVPIPAALPLLLAGLGGLGFVGRKSRKKST